MTSNNSIDLAEHSPSEASKVALPTRARQLPRSIVFNGPRLKAQKTKSQGGNPASNPASDHKPYAVPDNKPTERSLTRKPPITNVQKALRRP
jgi:hypothetical protein